MPPLPRLRKGIGCGESEKGGRKTGKDRGRKKSRGGGAGGTENGSIIIYIYSVAGRFS